MLGLILPVPYFYASLIFKTPKKYSVNASHVYQLLKLPHAFTKIDMRGGAIDLMTETRIPIEGGYFH
jgi:hypothetical protein